MKEALNQVLLTPDHHHHLHHHHHHHLHLFITYFTIVLLLFLIITVTITIINTPILKVEMEMVTAVRDAGTMSRLVIAFLPRNKNLLISWLQ